jgi:hypothetical protein
VARAHTPPGRRPRRRAAGAPSVWDSPAPAGRSHAGSRTWPSIRGCASPLNRSDVCGCRGASGSAVPSTRSAARPRRLRYKHDAGRAPRSSAPRRRVGLCCRRKRRRDVADRWQAVVERHPTGPLSSAGANADPLVLMRSRPWYAPPRGGWCACIGPPPARGCPPSRDGGGRAGVKSPRVSAVPPGMRGARRRTRSLTAITSPRRGEDPSSGRMRHNFRGCT